MLACMCRHQRIVRRGHDVISDVISDVTSSVSDLSRYSPAVISRLSLQQAVRAPVEPRQQRDVMPPAPAAVSRHHSQVLRPVRHA